MLFKSQAKNTHLSSLSKAPLRTFTYKPPKPSAGFKMPKMKEGEEIVGFRPQGNVDLFSKPKNFNFEQ